MNNRYLLISLLVVISLAIASNGYSQNCLKEISYKVTHASPGRSDGSVSFHFEGSAMNDARYIILNLTASRKGEREDKIKLPLHEAKDLMSGYYEFAIVDRKKEKCSKEISVEIKESENR